MTARRAGVPLLVALLCFVLPLAAVVRHGPDAVAGITWGYEAELVRLCSPIGTVCALLQQRLSVSLGSYSPEGFGRGERLAIEHYYVRWTSYDRALLRQELAAAADRGRWPMLTVEPWPEPGADAEGLMPRIAAGAYDTAIAQVCSDVQGLGRPVFVRWGHEMEFVTGRYPWARADPLAYVAAYRRFVDRCRLIADRIFYVWSPVGNKELALYWPGRPYADYVGVSVYAFPEWDLAHYGRVRSFDEIFAEKYGRVRGYDRPVMIAELGVTGTRNHQAAWMQAAVRDFERYPLLRSVVYFNAVDSRAAWPAQYRVPDWRLDLSTFTLRFAGR